MYVFILILTVISIAYLYWKLKENNTYWIKKNVIQPKPSLLTGHLGPVLFQKQALYRLLETLYNEFPKARYFGIYEFLKPHLVIKDVDLIKRIMVKDFDVFPEHSTVVNEEVDPLFARNILFMKGGDKWQRIRSMLSPTFTSSKMKMLYPLLIKVAQQFIVHHEQFDDEQEIDAKETFSRYASDIIATTAFGVECNSFANPEDQFYVHGKKTMVVSVIDILKIGIFPFLTKFFTITVIPRETSNFFRRVIKDAIITREEQKIVRPDMLHLIMEARKGRMKYDEQENKSDTSFAVVEESEIGKKQTFKYSDISDEDLYAQAGMFFLAGFETSSSALTFCTYELAINPVVQQKLRCEIDEAFSETENNFISYDKLLGMKYLDKVLTESLRKWPPVGVTDRKAVKSFILKSKLPGEKTVHFQKDTVCLIPIFAIHRDPQHYTNPDKFDPERFNENDKNPTTPFLAFGMGPKNCVGARLGVLEIKVLLCALLRAFEIVPVSKTQIPLVINNNPVFLSAEENNAYWIKKNVIQPKPSLVTGHLGPVLFRKQALYRLLETLYNEFPKARYFGIYQFLKPSLVIKDVDLIKRITVKDFDVFPEHNTVVNEEVDSLFARNILFMKGGDKWQRLRSMLSPTFTSSKMKMLYPLLIKVAQQFVNHHEQFDDEQEIDAKDTFSRYASDVIATTAFGVECNSFANRTDQFYVLGKKTMDVSIIDILKICVFPFLTKVFKTTIVPRETSNFFRRVVKDAIITREEKKIVRPDMLHLMMEARKGRIKYDEHENKSDTSLAVVEESEIGKKQTFKYSDISDEDLYAQAGMFFLAGYETSSSALTFCTYELAINPDVQEKLRSEIDEAFSETESNFINYDKLLGMDYLDKVLTESLRKWPPVAIIDRKAVKPFTLESKVPGEETVHFQKDTVCLIPIFAIHRDPQHYPNPDKFDPERFNENKNSSTPFLAFGMGPKNCLGARLGILEIKILLCAVLRAFEIVPVSKTQIPLVINNNPIFLGVEGDLFLGLKKRHI
ncbi:hypothetical protein FQR65_LT13256 [Abscondita terminalis]|nr:hypothetical protein FQR65_LT13256 [Abscondita terminalis]